MDKRGGEVHKRGGIMGRFADGAGGAVERTAHDYAGARLVTFVVGERGVRMGKDEKR